MAKGDLYRLISDAKADLANAKGFRDRLDKESQDYHLSYNLATKEILSQISSKGVEPTQEQAAQIRKACIKFCNDVYNKASTYTSSSRANAVCIVTGKPVSFNILLVQSVVDNNTNLYRIIKDRFLLQPKADLSLSINTILNTNATDANNLLDIGHTKAVSNYHIANTLGGLSRSINDDLILRQTALQAKLNILSKFDRYNDKVFQFGLQVVGSRAESTYLNTAKGAAEEKALKNVTKEYLDKFLSRHVDWAEQKGSDSKIEQITKALVESAVKRGAKVKSRPSKVDKTSNLATATINSKTTRQSRPKVEPLVENIKSTKSFINLIALLNEKLPPAVRANMSGSSLHNKTGRFSESARVVSVTPTAQGFPSIGYTYQRSPYDVFDPVLGKAPWNTPGRDPKKLVEKSIRDIARDMAIGRFYVRRV